MRNGFILYQSYKEYFEDLTGEEAKELLLAIFEYEKTRVKPTNLSTKVGCYFLVIKQQLDKNYEEYLKIVEKNRENGIKGGRPKTQRNPKNPMGYLGTEKSKSNPKNLDNDIDNDKDKEYDIDNDIDKDKKEKEIDKEKEKPQEKQPAQTKFKKPTKEEIKAFALKEKLRTDCINRFYNHYESNGWRVGKNPMKNWQASYRNWCDSPYDVQNKSSGNPFLDELRKEEEQEQEQIVEVDI